MPLSPWAPLLPLIVSPLRLLVCAAEQVTVYEAGAVQWVQLGTVDTVLRASLGTTCPTSLTGDDGDRQAFVLNGPDDLVGLEFNGTEVAVYGIAYASNSCQLGQNPTRALLDVFAPVPSLPPLSGSATTTLSANGPSQTNCVPFSPEAMTCGILLARWTQLDKRNRHRVYIATSGQRIAVLNATVALNLDAPDGQLGTPPALELPPIPDFKYPGNATDTTSTLSHFQQPTWGAASPSHRRLHPALIAMYSLLGVVGALCIAMGLLFVRWRMRRRRRTSAATTPKPRESDLGDTATERTSPSPSPAPPAPEPHLVEKHHPVKMLFRPPDAMSSANVTLATSDDADLDRAIEGTGLTKQELIASLNRLRDNGGASRSLARSSSRRSLSPPRYDD